MSVYYRCSHCGYTMSTPQGKCPKCGVNLVMGPTINVPRPAPAVKPSTCKKCGRNYKWDEIACDSCGNWVQRGSAITFFVIFGLLLLMMGFAVVMITVQMVQGTNPTATPGILACFSIPTVGSLVLLVWLAGRYRKAQATHNRLINK